MSQESRLITDLQDGALQVTMSAPATKNAIGKDMYLGLAQALRDAAQDAAVRVIWLRGAGGIFTSGNVVSEFEQTVSGDPSPVRQFLEALITFPKPIVAQVEGVAIGVGATMLMHCDLVYAAEDTRFRMPFVNLGFVPEAGSSLILPQMMGQAKAAELVLLGRMFSAREAQDCGLINAALPAEDLEQAVQSALQTLCAQPPEALTKSKALLRRPLVGDLMDRVNEELALFEQSLHGDEYKEAFAAFSEKRKPVFK
jgi:enoyl-CoA hydratase/carnithine racemase